MTRGIANRILLAALLGGTIAGLLLTGLQQFTVVPMILQAETYETVGQGHSHAHGNNHEHETAHAEEVWAPDEGGERTAYTGLANVLTGLGFGLLLTGCYALRGRVDWRSGIAWGVAGFAAFSLAPAIGLPPELPGAAAAELGARQAWWGLTVVATAAGLALVVFASTRPVKGLGVVLVIAPHLLGAPQPEHHGGLAPVELEQAFIFASLATNAVFWLILGGLTAFFFERFGRTRKGQELPSTS